MIRQRDEGRIRAIGVSNFTAAQIIIRWHLQNEFVVIPKSVTPSRLDENLAVFDFRLDDEDMAAIGRLDRVGGRIGPDPLTADF